MLYHTRTGDTIVVPDDICTNADLGLAHRQMQLHRTCRIDLCAWKWVSYITLIHHGHIVPSDSAPYDRALLRGLADTGVLDPPPFQEILDGLERLARDLRERGDGR